MDGVVKAFLERLKRMQAEYPREALDRPKDKTSFGYGEACGVSKGLLMAEQLLDEVLGEERDRT